MRVRLILFAVGASITAAIPSGSQSAPKVEVPPELSAEVESLLGKLEVWKWFHSGDQKIVDKPPSSQEPPPSNPVANKEPSQPEPPPIPHSVAVDIANTEGEIRRHYAPAPLAAIPDVRVRQHLQYVLDTSSPIAVAVFVGREKQIKNAVDVYIAGTQSYYLSEKIVLIFSNACDHIRQKAFASKSSLEAALRQEIPQAVERETASEGWTFNIMTGELEPPPFKIRKKFAGRTRSFTIKAGSIDLYKLSPLVAQQVAQTSAYLVALASGSSNSQSNSSSEPPLTAKLAQEKLRRTVVEKVDSGVDLDALKANAIGILATAG